MKAEYYINTLIPKGLIHSAVLTENSKNFMMMDEFNYYKIDVTKLSFVKYENENVSNFIALDGKHIYMQKNKPSKEQKVEEFSSFA